MIITAEMVDSFQLQPPGAQVHCAYKGCHRMGLVRLFFHEEEAQNQTSERICVSHAFDLANGVLNRYKFGR